MHMRTTLHLDDGLLQVLWTKSPGGAGGLRQRERRLGQVLAVAG